MNQTQRGVTTVRLALPATSSRTIYDELGDYVPWAATGVAVLAGLGALWRLRGRRGGKGGATGADTAQYDAGSGLHVPS
jgi:hypothetical protein